MALAMRGGGGPYSSMDEALKDDGIEILKLCDGFFRSLEQSLHFLHINLRRRIMLMPHHLLHPCRARIVKQGKGRGGVPQTMYDNAGFLHSRQAQAFGAGWSLSGLRPSSVFAPRPPIFTPTSTQGR